MSLGSGTSGGIQTAAIYDTIMRYDVNTTQEVLYVERGRMQVTIYTHEWEVITRTEMAAGDVLFSVTGGHGFEVLEDVRLIEVKQGPYPGDSYAKRFQE